MVSILQVRFYYFPVLITDLLIGAQEEASKQVNDIAVGLGADDILSIYARSSFQAHIF